MASNQPVNPQSHLFGLSPAQMASSKACTLAEVPAKRAFTIGEVYTDDARLTLLRLGIGEGDTLQVVARIGKAGPLILEHQGTQVAIGVDYARAITGHIV